MLTGDNERTAQRHRAVRPVWTRSSPACCRRARRRRHPPACSSAGQRSPWWATASTTPRHSPGRTSGIAIGAGTDVAIDAADVVLMKSTPERRARRHPPQPRDPAQHPREPVLGVLLQRHRDPAGRGRVHPLFGWTLNPMFGAAAMSLSSFCVVSNALQTESFQTA